MIIKRLTAPIGFHIGIWKSINRLIIVLLPTFIKIYYFVFNRRKKLIQV